MARRTLLAPLALMALLLTLAGCSSKSSTSVAGARTGTVTLRLTDAPADFDHVYLDVAGVSIHSADAIETAPQNESGDAGDGGWIALPTTPGIHDLLDLRNGVFVTLGSGLVPAGHYDQVRLKLGPANSLVISEVSYSLKVPSGMSSGYKLMGEFDVPADGAVDVGIDFDAMRSLHLTGAGQWMLKPVARTFPIPLTGSIAGSVVPAGVHTWAYAIQDPDTIATTSTDVDGRFTLSLLPPGTYSVHLLPTVSDFVPQAIDGVVVTAGHVTDLGAITLGAVAPQVVPPLPLARPAPVGPGALTR